jgi:formylglycine-generating enzyme required for sulfatase activity
MTRLLVILGFAIALTACASSNVRNTTRDCEHCPEMVVIPAGTAIVGASTNDRYSNPDERPERRIAIREPFAVSRYEITRDQYETFVHATNRPVGGDCLTDRVKRGDWQLDAHTTFRDPGFVQAGNHPVACVSWEEAQAYVAWLNAQTSGGYRLLTEVEWEYVARGGATENLVYPWGDDTAQGCPFANTFDQTMLTRYTGVDTTGYKVFDPMPCADGLFNTSPVGSLQPNGYGVYDVIGNVAEWVEGCFDSACTRRFIKGGSWGSLAHNVRIAERIPYAPTHRDDSIGIRVARTLPRQADVH